MVKEIQEYPELKPELKEAINNGSLVIFLGAGASRYVGCKSWNVLANELIDKCHSLGYINYHETDVLKSYPNQKKKISIAYGILKDKDENAFFEVFNGSLKWEIEKGKKNIYDYLTVLSKTFVTTNADTCIDEHFIPSDVIYDFSDNEKVSFNKVYHIHGHKEHKESLVFTVEQYLARYRIEPENKYLNFLNDLFGNYTVLFIGYGLEEFELLDYLTIKARIDKSRKHHYALMPYYSFEKRIADYDQIYYEAMNIEVIPYAMDNKGYDQLIEIIDNWGNKTSFVKQIDTELTKFFSQDYFTDDDIHRIMEIITIDKSFFSCFLRLCNKKPAMTVYLIKPLYDYGFFNPKHNCEYWEILSFLFSFVRCYKGESAKEAVEYFIKILDENTKLTEDRVNSYRTDNAFLELIFTLEEDKISENYLSFVEKLFKGKTDTFDLSYTLTYFVVPSVLTFSNKKIIKRIIEIVFSYVEDDNKVFVSSVVGASFLKTLIQNNFEKICVIIGDDFLNIILKIISSMRIQQIQIIIPKNYKSSYPVIDDSFYNISLFNILVWLVKKFNKHDVVISLLDDSNQTLQECGKKLKEALSQVEEGYTDSLEDVCDVNDDVISNDLTSLPLDEFFAKMKEAKNKNAFAHKVELWVLAHLEKEVLDRFSSVDLVYLDSITSGLESLVRSNKPEDNFEKKIPFMLDFFKTLLSHVYSKDEENLKSEFVWLHKNICNFVSDYVEKYIYTITAEQFVILKDIVTIIYTHLHSFSIENTSAFGYAATLLNSEAGTCYKALFSLQVYCFEVKKQCDVQIREIFNEEIRKKHSTEFFTLIGEKFNYLYFYDKDWINDNYFSLVDLNNHLLYRAFCSGYFYTPYQITKEVYDFLQENNFFADLLNSNFVDNEYFKKLSNIAYVLCMRNIEKVDDNNSLAYRIIHSAKKQFLNAIIDCFASLHNSKYFDKVLLIWQECITVLRPYKDNIDYNEVIIKLLHFINSIPKIDEKFFDLISFSIRYIPNYQVEQFILPKFLELYKGSESNRENIEKIIVAFSQKGTFFSNYDNKFSEIFLLIIENNKTTAEEIATVYYRHGDGTYMDLLNGGTKTQWEKIL
jgi:hypothetical protein